MEIDTGYKGTIDFERIDFVFRDVEINMRHRMANDVRIMTYFAYILLNARAGGSFSEVIPQDLQSAFDVVTGMMYLTESHKGKDASYAINKLLSMRLSEGSYLEIFHALLEKHPLLFLDKEPRPYGENRRLPPEYLVHLFNQNLNDYHSFISTLIGYRGGQVLDLDARYSLYDDYSQYAKYTIVEDDKYFRAFFILRKYLEGWDNVSVMSSKSFPDTEEFDYVFFSSDDNCKQAYNNIRSKIVLRYSGTCVYQCDIPDVLRDISFPEGHQMGIVLSVASGRLPLRYLCISDSSNESNNQVVFVDGMTYGMRESVKNQRDYYDGLIEAVCKADSRFVLKVPFEEVLSSYFDPGYYFVREGLKQMGEIPISSFISRVREEMIPYDRTQPIISIIENDERLIALEPSWPETSVNTCYKASSKMLLIGEYAGFVDPNPGDSVMIDSHITSFTIISDTVDVRYLVKCINDAIKYIKERRIHPRPNKLEIINMCYMMNLSLEDQQSLIELHLRTIRNEYLRGLNIPNVRHQVIIYTAEWGSFENVYSPLLEQKDIKVLDYITNINSLDLTVERHSGDSIPASQKADAMIADVRDINLDDIKDIMYSVKGTGLHLFFFDRDNSGISQRIQRNWKRHAEDFDNMLVEGDDFLDKIKDKLNALTDNILDEYLDFFSAAERFDQEYPDWRLTEYAKRILSKRPFVLDLNKFRTKIDNTIGNYFKVNKVVPEDMEPGAIPDLLVKSPYEPSNKDYKIYLQEHLPKDIWDNEKWIRSAYATIRKLGNSGSHNELKISEAAGKALFTLFTEIIVWIDQPNVRERYQSGRTLFEKRSKR